MRIGIAAAALAAMIGTTPVAAQIFPGFPRMPVESQVSREIGWQLDEIYDRIESARRTGRFSEPEARALHREGQRLFDRYAYMRRNGIDQREYRDLTYGIRALRDRIERRLRYGDWRDRRDDGWRNDDYRRDEDWREDRRDEDWRDDRWDTDDNWRERENQDDWQRDDDWQDSYSGNRNEGDEARDAGDTQDGPDDDWWLPPEERESIEPRPGDRVDG